MVNFGKYSLVVFAVFLWAGPGKLAGQANHTSKATAAYEQAKHAAAPETGPRSEAEKTLLHKDWQVQSSCEHKAGGERISTAGFEAGGWHRSDIPATVVGVLVTDKTYADPNYGTNLK